MVTDVCASAKAAAALLLGDSSRPFLLNNRLDGATTRTNRSRVITLPSLRIGQSEYQRQFIKVGFPLCQAGSENGLGFSRNKAL